VCVERGVLNKHRIEDYKRNKGNRLMHVSKIKLTTWNICIIMGKTMESVDTVIRRKVNITSW